MSSAHWPALACGGWGRGRRPGTGIHHHTACPHPSSPAHQDVRVVHKIDDTAVEAGGVLHAAPPVGVWAKRASTAARSAILGATGRRQTTDNGPQQPRRAQGVDQPRRRQALARSGRGILRHGPPLGQQRASCGAAVFLPPPSPPLSQNTARGDVSQAAAAQNEAEWEVGEGRHGTPHQVLTGWASAPFRTPSPNLCTLPAAGALATPAGPGSRRTAPPIPPHPRGRAPSAGGGCPCTQRRRSRARRTAQACRPPAPPEACARPPPARRVS